jgi:hypothetical protein
MEKDRIAPSTDSAMPMIDIILCDLRMPMIPSTIAAVPNRPPMKTPATGMRPNSSAAPPKISESRPIVLGRAAPPTGGCPVGGNGVGVYCCGAGE